VGNGDRVAALDARHSQENGQPEPVAENAGHRRHGYIRFYEYFHGDNGAGLGASHQTGWTGVVAKLIQDMRFSGPALGVTFRF